MDAIQSLGGSVVLKIAFLVILMIHSIDTSGVFFKARSLTMKTAVLVVALVGVSTFATADRLVTFSDGSTAWQNENGQVWGKSPSPRDDFDQFDDDERAPIVDSQNGTLYVPSGSGYVNTRTGEFTPGR